MGCLKKRVCLDCGTPHIVLVHAQHGVMSQDNVDCDDMRCPNPACRGERYEEHHTDGAAPRDEVEGGRVVYPEFDVQLGVWVESAAHKRRLLKERGLVCLEGELENVVEAQRREEERAAERDRIAYEAYQRDIAGDPEIRRAQDRFDRILATTTDPDEVRRQFYGR